MHACAGRPLEEVEAILADLEHPQVWRHRADIHDMRAKVQHVIADAGQLGEKDAQILRADRHFEVQQLLDREHIAMLLRKRRAIIEPVEIRQRLQIGLILDQLLGATMQQADMRIAALDDLAIQLHDEAQHAVRRGMLRAEVDRVVLDRGVAEFRVGGVRHMIQLIEIVGHQASPPAVLGLRARVTLGLAAGSTASASGFLLRLRLAA